MDNPFGNKIRRVGLFSLSGVADSVRVEAGIRLLDSWGVGHVLPGYGRPLRYLQASDRERADAFNALLADCQVDAFMALRGGYGVTRALDLLDWELLKMRGIPLVGYSDVTALLLAAWGRGCRCLVHGPMLCSTLACASPLLTQALRSFARCLAGETCPMLPGNRLHALRGGFARGPLVPMNLTMLCNLIGTAYMPSLSGCILALEDVGEAAYAIDRMLRHLAASGILGILGGLVFGSFTDCEHGEFLPEIFEEYASCVKGPVASGLAFGHIMPSASILMGGMAELDVLCGGSPCCRLSSAGAP